MHVPTQKMQPIDNDILVRHNTALAAGMSMDRTPLPRNITPPVGADGQPCLKTGYMAVGGRGEKGGRDKFDPLSKFV